MDAFDTVYTNVKKAVKNADEIENTVDALYSGWFHINAFFCLGICTGNVFGDKLSEMKKQRDAVEKIAFRYLLPGKDFLEFKRKLIKEIDRVNREVEHISEVELLNKMGFPKNWKNITRYHLN